MDFRLRLSKWLFALSALLGLCATAAGQSPVTVGVYLNPPFIVEAGTHYAGLAVELFEDVSRRGNLAPNFVRYHDPEELLAATAAGEVDIAIGNLTITRERAELVSFTYPWHDAGLRILTDGSHDIALGSILGELGDAGHLSAFFWLAFFVIAATILLTIFDRNFDREFPRTWSAGLAESFHHVMSVATSGHTSRKELFGPFGKVLAGLWLVFGVAVVAYVTSSVTSVMTAAAVSNQVETVDDLDNRVVGVLAGGASEIYARHTGLSARPFATINDAAEALHAGKVDAVIGDSMILEHYVHHVADAGVKVVGPVFDPEKYGFATPIGSPLTQSLSLDLMSAHEDGAIEALRAKYLGVAY